MFKAFAVTFFILLSATGCKKENDAAPASQTPEERLAGTSLRTWIQTGERVSDPFYADFTLLGPCSKDDLVIFYRTGKVEANEGRTKCKPDDPQVTDLGTWLIRNDSLVYNNRTRRRIESLTDDKMTLSITLHGVATLSYYERVK